MTPKILSKNKVQSMTTFACPVDGGQKTGKRFKKKEDFYDKRGNTIEHIEYKQGKVDKWEQFKYDNKGNLIVKTWYNCYGWDKTKFRSFTKEYSYDSNGQLLSADKSVIETDKDGNKVETSFYLNGKIKGRRIFNSAGLCTEDLEYKNEQIVKRSTFDTRGNLLSVYNFDTQGQPLNHSLFEYDDHDNQTRIKKVSRTGYVSQDRKLTYDKNNNLIEDTDIPKDFYKIHNDYHLNIIGGLEEEHTESYRHLFAYNDQHLLTEHKMFLAEKLIMIYEHDYKQHGQ